MEPDCEGLDYSCSVQMKERDYSMCLGQFPKEMCGS